MSARPPRLRENQTHVTCLSCALGPCIQDFATRSRLVMFLHLKEHYEAGHPVSDFVIEEIAKDLVKKGGHVKAGQRIFT